MSLKMKQQILDELDELPEDGMHEVLALVQRLLEERKHKAETSRLPTRNVRGAIAAPTDFWREPRLEERAAEQGVRMPQSLDQLVGQGHDLWGSDEDFRTFLDEARHIGESAKERTRDA